jgi:hypothetical protein
LVLQKSSIRIHRHQISLTTAVPPLSAQGIAEHPVACLIRFPLSRFFSALLKGSNGFWTHATECARFDQQPLEGYAMMAACVEAYALTGDSTWHRAARRCFEWFLGRNDLVQSLYDSSTGAVATRYISIGLIIKVLNPLAFPLAAAEMTRAEAVL